MPVNLPEIGTRYIACLPNGARYHCNILTAGHDMSDVEYLCEVKQNGKLTTAHFTRWLHNYRIFDLIENASYKLVDPYASEAQEAD